MFQKPVTEIVLGVDARAPAEGAVRFAFDTARLRGVRLRAVHAWRFPSCAAELPFGIPEEDRGAWEDHEVQLLTDVLRPWREKYPEVRVVEDVRLFTPAQALVQLSANAALVVVGRSSGAEPGTVSRALLRAARCPVTVVPL
ncbi:universal stress protein [Streptomyces sp. NPDC005483]|uniref:universal stress protein n=1 Tax=Streptomyces sp. NPDC005483 TaxID=3154882 RepID=UPI0033A92882